MRFVYAIGLPLLAACLWGVFAVPDDPSRSGETVIATPGWARLLLEFVFFAASAASLYAVGARLAAGLFGIAVIVHYAVSWERVLWLLRA